MNRRGHLFRSIYFTISYGANLVCPPALYWILAFIRMPPHLQNDGIYRMTALDHPCRSKIYWIDLRQKMSYTHSESVPHGIEGFNRHLMAGKNVLLIEPGYRNKYPPLGLMKIAQYHGPLGKKDNVKFIKGEDKSVLGNAWDRIYVTTLFSFEWVRISKSIDFALEAANGQADKVFVGGIAASLMHDQFIEVAKWRGIRIISGLLDKAPAISLQLDDFEEELYSEDTAGPSIESLTPSYDILDQIDYVYPVHDAYFVYASRGCVRKCSFCGVPKLEGEQRDAPSIGAIVNEIERLYGAKKDLCLMDNNVVASPNFKKIIAEIRDLGFQKGAVLKRGRATVQRRVDFNQGVDARILCKDPTYLRQLSTIAIKPLRIAFDHLGLKKPYEKSVRYAAEFGLTNLSNYMLYNFHDSPEDLFMRMRLNVSLNEELGLRIFSFPMRYQPTNLPDRSHVGEKWTRYQLRSMQVILQATHGIVSGAPEFFKQAFGNTPEDYIGILLRPHHFIFNRMWYERGDGRPEFDEYETAMKKLTKDDRYELLEFLSDALFATSGNLRMTRHKLIDAIDKINVPRIRNALKFYVPLKTEVERAIWDKQKESRLQSSIDDLDISEDEKVEDAGLDDISGDNLAVNAAA